MPFSDSKFRLKKKLNWSGKSKKLIAFEKEVLESEEIQLLGGGGGDGGGDGGDGGGGGGGSGVDNETLTLVSLPVDVSLFLHLLLPVVSFIK